jgi:allophanate hydrolase
VRALEARGGVQVEIDYTPFRDAGRLLYEGAWLAERWAAVREFHAKHADKILPVTREILEGGAKPLAADAFDSFHKLTALRRAAEEEWSHIDVLLLPTTPTIYTRKQIEANPVELNSRLGYYTSFANLLDTAAVAIPAGFRPDGLPFGVTLFAPAWGDAMLASIGAAFQRGTATKLGGSRHPLPAASTFAKPQALRLPREFQLAVVGAHLSGQPLNSELMERGGRLVRTARTAENYRLYALAGSVPARPGLVRVAPGEGAGIEVEVWTLPPAAWAELVAAIPAPLGIGTLILDDGSKVSGFLCEPAGIHGAEDITAYGGWRAYRQGRPPPAR